MARRGRPRGALSWARNPVNFAAHHAKVLLELWLAGVPIQIGPEYNLLPSLMTTDRRLVQPKERERTVPPRIKRVLCRLAIAHVVEHFSQHTGQIIFATKMLTGEDLGFYRHLRSAATHGEKTP